MWCEDVDGDVDEDVDEDVNVDEKRGWFFLCALVVWSFSLGVEMGGITSFGSIPAADREKPVAIPRATVSLMLMAVESGLVLHR